MAARRPSSDTVPSCPFCSYTAPSHSETDIYMLYQHVELSHNDQESPFMETEPGLIRGGPSSRSRSRSNSGKNRLDSSPSPDDDVYVVIVGCRPTFQVWIKKITIGTVIKNGRGIFSVQSLSRNSRKSSKVMPTEIRDIFSSEVSFQNGTFEMMNNKGSKVEHEVSVAYVA